MSKVKHIHAEVIKAWADGAEIEFKGLYANTTWRSISDPCFDVDQEYRVKPEPKPDVVLFAGTAARTVVPTDSHLNINLIATPNKYSTDNIKLTFDGETGKLKAAEVLS